MALYSQYILKWRRCSPRSGSRQRCRSLRRKRIQLRKLCSQNHFRLVRPIYSISFFLHCVHFHYSHVYFLSFSRQMYQYYLFFILFSLPTSIEPTDTKGGWTLRADGRYERTDAANGRTLRMDRKREPTNCKNRRTVRTDGYCALTDTVNGWTMRADEHWLSVRS